MRSPPARARADYLLKDHKPSAMECEARLRGPERIIYSKTIFQHPGKEQQPATAHARLTGGGFAEGACVPSLVLSFRTPQTPPSPTRGEGGLGGMRGKSAQECRKLLISLKNSTLERHTRSVGWASLPNRHCTPCNRGRPLSRIAPPLAPVTVHAFGECRGEPLRSGEFLFEIRPLLQRVAQRLEEPVRVVRGL
jgi:hypothetical protein